jgi:hypothetical protein
MEYLPCDRYYAEKDTVPVFTDLRHLEEFLDR